MKRKSFRTNLKQRNFLIKGNFREINYSQKEVKFAKVIKKRSMLKSDFLFFSTNAVDIFEYKTNN